MSLSLLQGYSSAEEEEETEQQYITSSDGDGDGDGDGDSGRHNVGVLNNPNNSKPLLDPPNPSSCLSSLPSALDAFSEIAGPPEFLNNCVDHPASGGRDVDEPRWRHGRRRNRNDKKDLPAGAVMEAKAQLVGIRERVSSDAEGKLTQTSSTQAKGSSTTAGEGGRRVATAANPNAEDAAELLRMCLQCGIPKTFSNARGIVCPVCGDRAPSEAEKDSSKKRTVIKDKEKSKRMKGQSSHATWKSETEMQLRQQFD